jgi:hypothetical protein
MKNRFGFAIILPLLLSVSHPALAAATPEEAARLASVFQTYLTAEKGVVTVAPAGDDYTVTIDIAPLTAKAAASGDSMSLTPLKLTLTSKGDGKWTVSQNQALELSIKAKDAVSGTFKAESYSHTGVFDEKLFTFEQSTGEMKNVTFNQVLNEPAQGETSINIKMDSIKTEQSATANANGGADMKSKYILAGLVETVAGAGNPSAGAAPMNFTLTAASGEYVSTGKGMKVKSIYDLISFFVAHQDKNLIMKDGAALKTILTAAMPIFENVNGTAALNDVNVITPMGPVGVKTITMGADINGIVKEGKFGENITMSGLVLPPTMVPAWATTLVPQKMTFDFTATGFDLATPAQLILAAIDFTKEPPLPEGFENSLLPAFLPKGSATITLNPTSISNDIYSINAEGAMTAGPAALPSGKAKITAKGLDDILKAIQAAPPEAGVQGGIAVIIGAKGMGKAEADGTLVWNIESTSDGKVTINGIDPSKMQ